MKHISIILKEALKRIDHDKKIASIGNSKFKLDMKELFNDQGMFDNTTMHERLTNTDWAD